MKLPRNRRTGDRRAALLLPPSFPLQCGWCGGTRTRPLDSACPVCGGAWYRLSVTVAKIARHM